MRLVKRFATGVAWLLASGLAFAHGDEVHGAAVPWTFDAWVTAPLILSALWYAIGWWKLHQRATHATHRASATFFATGWLVLAAALITPLHAAGERSFAAHMFEHELLMLAAAPLLVLSRPLGVALWAFPQRMRIGLASGSGAMFGAAWRMLTTPVVATLVQAAVLWLWHAPHLFDLALANDGWHVVQHLCFLVSALLFWWAVLHGRGVHRIGVAVGCLFFTATVSGALGALMAFSNSPWYAGYAASGLDAFGLTPAEDQQFAGVLMWVPGGLVHAGAGLALLARRLREGGGTADALD
ncbi:MAG TPA: cytochrome c oxidase assembly protein [Lysobacter sp.]|nr:cytochrome c oxidase assembly protein [Lysobacter sp.]